MLSALKKPRALKAGDTLAVVSPSWGGAGKFSYRYQSGKRQLAETFNVNVIETKHALRSPEWLARNPQARAEDLMEAFANPSINGIISAIGGDDSIRITPFLDLDIKRTPTCPFCPPGTPSEIIEVYTTSPVEWIEDLVEIEGKFGFMDNKEVGVFFKLSDAKVE